MSDAVGFIKIGNIKGDATDENHRDWIEVTSVNHSIFRNVDPTMSHKEAIQTARSQINALMCTKKGDSSSPEFVKAACEGKVFPHVELHLCRTTPKGLEAFYIWKLTDAVVSNYEVSASGGDGNMSTVESFALAFGTIRWEYKKSGPKGPAGTVMAGWDREKGKTI